MSMTIMSHSVIQAIKRIALNGSIAIALSCSASTEGRAQSMDNVINETSSFLQEIGPTIALQRMASTTGNGNTCFYQVYGACGEWLKGDHVGEAGSYYCPAITLLS